MAPYVPRYVSPKEAAENRARWRRLIIGIIVFIPLFFVIMLFGYSDQAPAPLREFTIWLDRTLGYPILGFLRAIAL